MTGRLRRSARVGDLARVSLITGCLFAGFVAAAYAAGGPTQSGAPSISGTMRVSNTITLSSGSWTDSPTSFLYQFVRCAAICDPTGSYAPIGPASSNNTYRLAQADAGHQLYGLVQATNASGSTVATAYPTPVIANADGSAAAGTTSTTTTTTTATTTTTPTTPTTTTVATTTTTPTTTAPATTATTTAPTTKSTTTTTTKATTTTPTATSTTTATTTSKSPSGTTTGGTTSTTTNTTTTANATRPLAGSTTSKAPTTARRKHPAPKPRIKARHLEASKGRRLRMAFSASSSRAIAPASKVASYTWTFGDRRMATGLQVVHRYLEKGTFTVTLTVKDDLGTSAKARLVIHVR